MASNFLTHDGLIFYDTKLKAWISANFTVETLPIASGSTLGGIKVGPGLSIGADGLLSVVGATVTWDVITGKPTFSAVATTGNYTDLNNKPSIPSLVSQLTNDSNYQTAAQVAQSINNAEFLSFEKVDSLPSIGSANTRTIYLVPKAGGTTGNVYEEWLVINGSWELIGTTSIDLSNYWTKSELTSITNAQIDALFV